jgi:hypothetical protein
LRCGENYFSGESWSADETPRDRLSGKSCVVYRAGVSAGEVGEAFLVTMQEIPARRRTTRAGLSR